jgi:Zn-dependent M28 family amino/carboxypeptidase
MKKAVLRFTSLLLGLLVFYSCGNSTGEKTKSIEVEVPQVIIPEYNADSAYAYVDRQVAFGPRVPNSEAHEKATQYFIRFFEKYADKVISQDYDARAYNGKILHGHNIIAIFNPDSKRRILLSSHWDSRPYADHDPDADKFYNPIDGANDGASGVGVLMEVARSMATQKPEIGVDIILFDLEDYGDPANNVKDSYALGSQYWSQNPHTSNYQAEFGILLDMVGAKDAIFTMEYFSLNFASDIVKMVWQKAQNVGHENYFLFEPGAAIEDDHIYVNRFLGIPMIDIIHLDPDSKNGTFFDYWHTSGDTMDNIDKNTLKAVGETLLQVIYSE